MTYSSYARFSFSRNEGIWPSPSEEGGRIVLEPNEGSQGAQKLCQALSAWAEKVDSLEAGEITQFEYDEWKASLGGF